MSASYSKGGIFQNTTRLNIFNIDPVNSQTNTLGVSPITGALSVPSSGQKLHTLLIRRGDNYGWNWRALHQKDHPILDREHKENLLTALKNEEIKEFRLPPVSMKGRPVMANMDVGGENVTLKATHNNEKIYFNERENQIDAIKPKIKPIVGRSIKEEELNNIIKLKIFSCCYCCF